MTAKVIILPLGPIQTNCYLLGDPASGEAAIIDPGWDAPQVLAAVKKAGLRIKIVLLTHAHFDHIGGVAGIVEATGVPLALHPLDLPLLRELGGAKAWGIPMEPCPEPDILLAPGQVLEIGSLKLEILFVPGHTPGHVAFYERREGIVFGGDVLFRQGIGRTDLPGGNYATLMSSLREQLLTLPDDTIVYSGHGEPTTIGDERRENPFLA
ncbi:MAG: MBL fold metallo-hydrolase [Chloroflexi bacterium]|nr:MBL fold metallo-hydrolase [Chloroflexota bacterium]